MIDGRNFFDQPINSMIKTYENIRKIAAGQGDDCTTGCLVFINEDVYYWTMFFITEKAKETVLDFSQGTVKVLWMQFHWLQNVI